MTAIPVWIFLFSLLITPQVWWAPMLDMRVDFFVYPFWLLVLFMAGRAKQVFQLGTIDKLFLFMFAWTVISASLNGWPDVTGTQLFHYGKYFVVMRLVSVSITNPKELARVGYGLMLMALVLAIEAIQHYRSESGLGWAGQPFGWISESASTIGLDARVKWVGIFDGPGVFCVVFTTALPFAFRYLAPPTPIFLRLLALGGAVVPICLAAFYTGSRGGILATAGTVLLFILSRYKVNLKKLALIGGIAALGFTAAAPSYLTETKDKDGSAQGRIEMWAKSFEMVRDNPAFGIGRGTFGAYTGRLVAHNSALETMGELGFPGLFAWMAMMYMGFKAVMRLLAENVDQRARESYISVGLALAGYLISSVFVTLETEIMYFLVGLTVACANMGSVPLKMEKKDIFAVLIIMAAYVIAFKLYVSKYY